MALAPEHTGIGIRRRFTTPHTHPYDELEWERRDARITNFRDGSVAFEQLGVEFPTSWSLNATNIVAQKYFRGTPGTPERETSLRQVVDRVVDTITGWGSDGGYFTDAAETEAFRAELKHLMVTQKAAFNSPVWFNIGVPGVPAQASACQPYDALVSTPEGLVPIGRLVEDDAVGRKVHDASGVTQVVATKANGTKPVLRLHTKAGYTLDVTADHLVWRATRDGSGSFVPAGRLLPGDRLSWHRAESWGDGQIDRRELAEAALAGWLQSDRFVGQYDHGTNRSLTIEFLTVTEAEYEWVLEHLEAVFPDAHRKVRPIVLQDPTLDGRRIRLYGKHLRLFVERWGLLDRGAAMRVPPQLFTAPRPVVAAYLRSVFQADGYVSLRERAALIGLDLVGEDHVRDIQRLLVRFGIFSRVRPKNDPRPDRQGMWSLTIRPLPERDRFAAEIGFIDSIKAAKLEASLDMVGIRSTESKQLQIDRIESIGEMEVFDIQTESGEYLSGGLRVHNCFILSVEDTMDSILNWYVEEGTIFKGGSGSGINLSRIRSSAELLKGGGTASGPVSFMRGADASAGTIKCLHADTPLVTDHGLVPIRDVQPSWRVLTRYGYEPIEAVHDNGVRPLVRVRTALGDEIRCTPEHRFRVRGAAGETWRRAGELRPDDHVLIDLGGARTDELPALAPVGGGHHNEIPHELPTHLDEGFAMWLGWVYGDGSITSRGPANFVAVQIGDADPELVGRYRQLTQSVFGPAVHLLVDRHEDRPDASGSVRFCSTQIICFLEANGLRKEGQAHELTVPALVQSAPVSVRAAFLAGLFEADGHIANGYPHLSTVSSELAVGVHRLLASIGIPSTLGRIDERCTAFGTRPVHTVRIVGGEGVRRFAKLVGFVSERKHMALEGAVARKGAATFETQWYLPHVDAELDEVWRRTADPRLRRAIAPYCRYATPRKMSLLRARALLERFPDELGTTSLVRFACGDDLYTAVGVEPDGEGPTFDLTVAGVHEYLVHNVVTHNSGGKTRRAAKMVILDVDHPDVEEFIWCKAREEQKARVLRDAGFEMDLDGRDAPSIQYQNANNSVRVTDEFMRAVENDEDWHLRAVTTGEIVKTVRARDLMRQFAQASWECADPGMQFDTTINRWHTAATTGRINASNPCCFVGETLVETEEGPVSFEMLHKRREAGEELPLAHSFDQAAGRFVLRQVPDVWIAGATTKVVELTTRRGLGLRCTPEHRFLTGSGDYVEARDLVAGVALRTLAADGQVDSVENVQILDLEEEVAVYDLEVAGTHNFAVTSHHPSIDHAVVVHNSEYMHLDDSACNLASINLLAFLGDDDVFDVAGYTQAIEVVFCAQEILVGRADYPTEAIGANARRFRQLGLGYANLGATLMALGMPYDSDAGRAWAAALTALMTGHAYATSARTAARMGPFAGYADNADHMRRVLNMHREETAAIDEELVPAELLGTAQQAWDQACELGAEFGVRNSQASVLAPTGCLVGGSLVATDQGLVRMRSLGDPDGKQWQDLDVGVLTDAGPRPASQFYVNGLETVVDVTTRRGYRIQGTAKHRIKVVDESGAWTWRRFADLRPGDQVPLALGQLIGDPQWVALPPLGEGFGWKGEHHARVPEAMNTELAELVGYFMGDGSLHAKGLRLCVSDGDFDLIEDLQRKAKSLFGIEALVRPAQGYTSVELRSVRLAEWWKASGFAKYLPHEAHVGKGWTPHIPDAVLHSNDPEIYQGFLRGLYEADGTVTAGYPSWTTTAMSFSHDVQTLLLTLGFITTRAFATSGRGSRLAVLRLLNKSSNARWLEQVGFLGGRKQSAVDASEGPQSAGSDDEPGFFFDTIATAELGDEELTYDLSVPDNVTYVANGFISHNTIGLMMDCDTTGIEPDLGLCKMKKLVGGGTMTIVNQTVPRALKNLGYLPGQIEEIVAWIDDNKTILGAPHVAAEHLPVFACSMGDNAIHYAGHVRMMGAVQPFISGAISKTVNMPEDVTVEDVEQIHIDAWKLGVKAVAIYRDNCKVAQPLAMAKKGAKPGVPPAEVATQVVEKIVEKVVKVPVREKLPRTRTSRTFEFRVADCKGFVNVGQYADGRPGEVFLRVSKQGSTLAGIMDSFAIAVSHGLQYGVPLRSFVEAFTNMRFEPAGMTDDPEIRIASSVLDYIFRRLAVDYLSYEERAELGILTVAERTQPTLPGVEETITENRQGSEVPADPKSIPSATELAASMEDADVVLPAVPVPESGAQHRDAPYCMQCGVQMVRAGSCHACPSCGSTSGCS